MPFYVNYLFIYFYAFFMTNLAMIMVAGMTIFSLLS